MVMEAATSRSTSESTDPEPKIPGLGDLPDAVLGEIISLLPTKDGARTQILASQWRHLWRAASLNFDYRGLPDDEDGVLPGVILSAHEGPVRRLCLPASVPRHGADVLEAWLRSPALDNLQELDFYVPRGRSVSIPHVVLPASLFLFSSTLRVATICKCRLSDNTVEALRFPQLRKLAIVNVIISQASLDRLIATTCPGLESLLLSTTYGIRSLRINSPALRSIGIRWSLSELIIENAPLLERLLHLEKRKYIQIVVISAPKLGTLGCISELSRVVFGSTVIQRLRIDNLTTVVGTVKILAIDMLYFDLDMLIGLMRCFPYLEKLYMKGSRSGQKNLSRRKHLDFLRSHEIRLKTIVMGYYKGIQAQVSFVTFFVLNARMLESIRLQVVSNNYNAEFFAEQHMMLQMEKSTSRGVRLCFTADCSHSVEGILDVSDLDLTDPFACGC